MLWVKAIFRIHLKPIPCISSVFVVVIVLGVRETESTGNHTK
jgi:hypothetical protein